MSNILSGICQKKRFGSAPIKAVVMYMADRASDDGGGIWTSKGHIAADTELSKRTVQLAIKQLESAGLVVAVGQRKHGNGYTIEYSLDVSRIKELPSTREKTGEGDSRVGRITFTSWGEGDSRVGRITFTSWGAGDSPKPSFNHP